MTTINIMRNDGTLYWTESFNDLPSAQEWVTEEMTRPYWDPTYVVNYVTVDPPAIVPPTTAQLLAIKGMQAQNFGAQVVAAVYALNEGASISQAQLEAMMADATLATVERLLWNGSLATARALIAGMPNTFFTADQITSILTLLDGFIAQLG